MKTNETINNGLSLIEGIEIDGDEMATIAASLPVQTNVKAGALPPPCCDGPYCPNGRR